MAGEAIEFERGSKVCGRLLWGHVKAESCLFHRCIFYGDTRIEGAGTVISHSQFLGRAYIRVLLLSGEILDYPVEED